MENNEIRFFLGKRVFFCERNGETAKRNTRINMRAEESELKMVIGGAAVEIFVVSWLGVGMSDRGRRRTS